MSENTKLFVKWYDITGWILDRAEKFPKSQRFIFGQRLSNGCLDILESIVKAQYTRRKSNILLEINLKVEIMRVLLRLCSERRLISGRQYAYIAHEINEAGKMIGGWIKQQNN